MTIKPVILAAVISAIAYMQWQKAELADAEQLIRSEMSSLVRKNETQQAHNARLKSRLALIEKDSDNVFETLARRKLFMVKPGEIYVLPLAEER